LLFSLLIPPPPRSTLFPYTTLFRSRSGAAPERVLHFNCDLKELRSESAPLYHRYCGQTHPQAAYIEIDCECGGVDFNVRRLRMRSEEHTSELQSRRDLVCRLLLEKK